MLTLKSAGCSRVGNGIRRCRRGKRCRPACGNRARVGTARSAPLPALLAASSLCLSRSSARADGVADFYRGKTINVLYRGQCRRRLRFRGAAAGPLHAGAHPGQSAAGAAEHDRRRRHQDGQLSLFHRAAGRHRHRHVPQYADCRAGGRHRGRAIRRQQVLLARLDHHEPADARDLAYGRACSTHRGRAHARRLVVAASNKGAITYTFPRMLNEFLGTRLKIVSGYQGNSTMMVAMERGEVEGVTNSWDSWKSLNPAWLRGQEDQAPGADRAEIEGPRRRSLGAGARPQRGRPPDHRADRVRRRARQAAGDLAQRAGRARAGACATPSMPPSRIRPSSRPRRAARIEINPIAGVALQDTVEKVPGHAEEPRRRAPRPIIAE